MPSQTTRSCWGISQSLFHRTHLSRCNKSSLYHLLHQLHELLGRGTPGNHLFYLLKQRAMVWLLYKLSRQHSSLLNQIQFSRQVAIKPSKVLCSFKEIIIFLYVGLKEGRTGGFLSPSLAWEKMEPERDRHHSFRCFIDDSLYLTAEATGCREGGESL